MRYVKGVRRLRMLADVCERANRMVDEPLLVGAYVFGDLLNEADEFPRVQVALVINRPADEVTWFAEPPDGPGIAFVLDLGKSPLDWYFRPLEWPVWNHLIRGPVRFWSPAGPDEAVLDALEHHQLAALDRLVPTPAEELAQLEVELDAALAHLRGVDERYWDDNWRADHKGNGTYPEDHLWRAVHGYLDLLAAVTLLRWR